LDAQLQARGWSVVVGRSFGSGVTHKRQCYAYLEAVPGVHVLCFKP
jgi:hypothetical protein